LNIEIVPVCEKHKSVLRQLIELYCYDFSEYTHDEVDEHGFYGYSYLDHYWTDETRHPFFIKVNGNYAGFVLVSNRCRYITNEKAHTISEFFIMRRYRRQNVGDFAAKYIFDLFKGDWEVRVLDVNKPAHPFWNKVINGYTNGEHIFHSEPTPDWDGFGYSFKSI